MQATTGSISDRRRFLIGAAAAGGAGALGLSGEAAARSRDVLPFYDALPSLAPFRLHADRISKITVCLRPFRAAGPRLDAEAVGDKLVVHNYGHGGSGWSLSWGSADIAVRKALAGGERDIAVIGCGALGITAAITAQRAGARVTIYAKDRTTETRSARATGTWSPDSRIALGSAASPEFPALWEQMCRASFKTYHSYLGLPGSPVEWTDRYTLSDISPEEARARRHAEDTLGFAQYQDRVKDLTPRPQLLPAGAHPFPTAYVQRNSSLMFNVTALAHLLQTDFLLAGGKIETREFHAPGDLTALPQRVIINCTGYGARALWKDESIAPVRGQIAWLIPQPEVTYGLYFGNVTLLSRRDGVVMQYTGATEAAGFNLADETPDRAEAEAALGIMTDLYSRFRPSRRRS